MARVGQEFAFGPIRHLCSRFGIAYFVQGFDAYPPGIDAPVLPDPPPGKPVKVTIGRGALGSYNLEIEGRNGLIKVTRLK